MPPTPRTRAGKKGPTAEWTKNMRQRLGMTQAELGEHLGHLRVWVCNVEAGRAQAGPAIALAMRYLLLAKKKGA